MSKNNTRWYQGDQRRECSLNDYNLLRSAGSEKRCQMKIGVPLAQNGNLVGAPEWIINDFTQLVKSAAISKKIVYDSKEATIQGMTIEMWSTEKSRTRFFPPLTGCTLRPLYMERTGKEEEKSITLYFMAYAGATKAIHDWSYDYDKATFWSAFDLVQSELNLDGDADDDDDDDEEEEDE